MSKTIYKKQVEVPVVSKQYYQNNINKLNKLNILIVDDEQNSRDSLRDLIKMRGHNVTTIDDGLKCVNRCGKNKYDIIFMDYHINSDKQKLNGAGVINIIRECFDVNSVIYAYTGDNTQKAINDFKSNAMNGAFIKPIEPSLINEFLRTVEKNIDDPIQLRKLAIKKKQFMYFTKSEKYAECN